MQYLLVDKRHSLEEPTYVLWWPRRARPPRQTFSQVELRQMNSSSVFLFFFLAFKGRQLFNPESPPKTEWCCLCLLTCSLSGLCEDNVRTEAPYFRLWPGHSFCCNSLPVLFIRYSLRVIALVLYCRVLTVGATETINCSLDLNAAGPCKNQVLIKGRSQQHK